MNTDPDEIDALARRFDANLTGPLPHSGREALARVAARGTCREFRDEPVSPALLEVLFACALSAPSKSDLQQIDIIQITSAGLRIDVADAIADMPWVRTAPAFAVVCGNGRRLRTISRLRGGEFANDDLDGFFNIVLDAGIVTGTLVVLAESIGLGTCAISAIRNQAQHVSDALGLPDHVFPAVGLCLGWPAQEPRISPRLPLSLTVHENTYSDDGWEDAIAAYDARRGKLAGFDPADPDFFGWSSRKAHMSAAPQRPDFGTYIRSRGFNLD